MLKRIINNLKKLLFSKDFEKLLIQHNREKNIFKKNNKLLFKKYKKNFLQIRIQKKQKVKFSKKNMTQKLFLTFKI
jgi:hypothetical protein